VHFGCRLSPKLRICTAVEILLGVGALVIATVAIPIESRVGIGLHGAPTVFDTALGVAFWAALALVGSSRVEERPEGSLVTHDLPFIIAAAVLGGPVAGGWVAMVGSLELRELRSVPWYGTLANHALTTLGVIVGGAAAMLVRPWLTAVGRLGPSAEDLVVTLIVGSVTIVLTAAPVIATVAFRRQRSVSEVARDFGTGYHVTMAAETVLAWLMVVVYLAIGWWAPIVCVTAILAIWQAHDVDRARALVVQDGLTRLLNAREFRRQLEEAIGRGRRRRDQVALVLLDLEEFRQVNDRYGTDVGDEVLREVGRRLKRFVRSADAAARLGDDDFGVLLSGVPDEDTVEQLAWRIHEVVTAPVVLRTVVVDLRASVGVAAAGPATPGIDAVTSRALRALRRAQRAGGGVRVEPAARRLHALG
jgi:diguanylate cyclase (GGDEF)-like protein